MNFLVELFAELFGWLGLRRAEKDLTEGNKKRGIILLALFMVILTAIVIYIVYGVIQFVKSY